MGADPQDDTETPAARIPWGLTGIVLGVLALAHVGLFLLLTVDARTELQKTRAAYSEAELASAKDPGPSPSAESPDYPGWTRARVLWESSRNERSNAGQRDVLGYVLAASWAAQAAFVAFLMLRTARRRQVRPGSPRRASTSG